MPNNKIIQNTSDIKPARSGGFFVTQNISENLDEKVKIKDGIQAQSRRDEKNQIQYSESLIDSVVSTQDDNVDNLGIDVSITKSPEKEEMIKNDFEESFLAQVEESVSRTSSDMLDVEESEVLEQSPQPIMDLVHNSQQNKGVINNEVDNVPDRLVEDMKEGSLQQPREINLGIVQAENIEKINYVDSDNVVTEDKVVDNGGNTEKGNFRVGYRESFNFSTNSDEYRGSNADKLQQDSLSSGVQIGSIDYGNYSSLDHESGNNSLLKDSSQTSESIEEEAVNKKIGDFLNQEIDPVGKNAWGDKTEGFSRLEGKKCRSFLPIKRPNFSLSPFVTGAFAISLVIMVVGFASFGLRAKDDIEVRGARAVNYIKEAKVDLQNKNFELATTNLVSAKGEFKEAQDQINKLGGKSLDIFAHIPFLSKISSGKNVVALGDGLTDAVVQLSTVSELLSGMGNPLNLEDKSRSSLTDIFVKIQESIALSKGSLEKAEKASSKIKVEDLPEEYQEKISFIKDFLPLVNDSLDEFDRSAEIFLELFGHHGQRKYLIVFQNNHEMRATGGFIGSYGLLETGQGRIDKLKIEGIYNPDGQLKVDVVPPRPIQKVSAAWSTHDANWFPDFPKSAEKISWFYEKTGGPTVDGVIAVTPVLLQKMLEVTGPVEMRDYDKTITSKNFIKEIQQEVEIDYKENNNMGSDKGFEEIEVVNDPKKILADLTPKLFAKFFDLEDPRQAGKVIKILLDSLQEKHILISFADSKIQKIVSEQGWAGEILKTEKDYLMVINSNINGYKTDGVIEEQIKHQAEIQADGSIIDTVTIIRKHNGGNTKYEWWNKVNSNYMRVYVPEGSKLISAEGHTREVNQERLNYDKLGFQVDTDVKAEESYMEIDNNSGTRIYTENDKTVFANWVYVSPQERVTVVYKYLLPFKVDIKDGKNNRYSLLMQKQSGSVNSSIKSEIEFPFAWNTTWVEPKNLKLDKQNGKLLFSHDLDMDQFIGAVFKGQ